MKGSLGAARRRARELAFRVIFEADVAGVPLAEAWKARRGEEGTGEAARALVDDVIAALAARGDEVDGFLRGAAEHWELGRLAATDRAVLRAAAAELLARPATPVRVVLDEAIEIAKRFGAADSGRFVNGVLDRVARELRPGEF
ncbi:MAG TPA: transcription antitermination factor NusB [Candidatus Eisenbacteria bacterium]